MASISIEKFYQYVAPYVAGAPKQVVLNEIMNAIVDFCDETDIVEVELDPVSVESGATEFELDIPGGSRVSRVKHLTPQDGFPQFNQGSFSLHGNIIKFTAPIPMNITVVATVALKPTRSSGRCDDSIYEDWLDAIIAGSLFKLKSMIGREWADMNSAKINEGLLRRSMVKARHSAKAKRIYGLGRVNLAHAENNYFG